MENSSEGGDLVRASASVCIESDEEEPPLKLSYSFNLFLMQVPGTFVLRTKCLGQVTLEAMELFDDEDSVMGMLQSNALELALSRFQQTAGFVCSGFQYSGYPGPRGDPASSKIIVETSKIIVETREQLDKCLEFVEDSDKPLDITLVPLFRLLFENEKEGDTDCRMADFWLDISAKEIRWDWISKEIKQITGDNFVCSYRSNSQTAFSLDVSSQQQLDELLEQLFLSYHQLIMAGARALCRDDFVIRLMLLPQTSQVTINTMPAGLPGAMSSALQINCTIKADGGAEVFSFGSVRVAAPDIFAGVRDSMQTLVDKAIKEFEKASNAKRIPPPALQGMPIEVRAGKSRVIAFIYRMASEEKTVVQGHKPQDADESEEEKEEEWAVEDENELRGFKVDSEETWLKFRELLLTDEELQERAVMLLLETAPEGATSEQQGPATNTGSDAKGAGVLENGGEGRRSSLSGGDERRGEEVCIEAGTAVKLREPLKNVTLMCYDGNSDPIKMQLRPQVTWRDLSTQLAKIFGVRSNLLRLCYKPNTSSQVFYIETEQHLLTALHNVQRKWQLGAGDGVLHCAIYSSDDPKAPTAAPSIGSTSTTGARGAAGGGRGRDNSGKGDLDASRGAGGAGGGGGGVLTKLHLAARGKDLERVRALLSGDGLRNGESKVGVLSRDSNACTALHYACSANALQVAQLLIEYKCDVNIADLHGCTPLHIAAVCEDDDRQAAAARAPSGVSDKGSDEQELEEQDREEASGREIVKLLIQHRARLNARDSAGWTALHWAASVDQAAAAAALIKAGADVDAPSLRWWTPLHVAGRYGSITVAGCLVRSNADVLRRNSDGLRAMDLAGESSGRRVSKDLREATKHAVGIEHANKRLQHTDIKTSEVSVLVRSLVKLVQGDKEEGLRKLGKPSTENAIFHHFAVHDSNKDGVLTMEEFHAALEAPPFKLPFLQRQKLHQYMDVDGDGMIDVEEFATALFGRPPPAPDKSYISIIVEQIELDGPLVGVQMAQCQFLRAFIDFMGINRDSFVSQDKMLQCGSAACAVKESWIPVNHQQRFCVDALTHISNRDKVLQAIMHHQEMLRAEIILFGQTPSSSEAEGNIVELGSGLLCLVPERSDTATLRETRRVPIYTYITQAEELPSSWRELSAPDLLAIIRRTPLSLQKKLKAGDRGGPPTRTHMVELLAGWERETRHARVAADSVDPQKEEARQRRRRIREATLDPIAVAIVSIRATHVLDSIVVELARTSGPNGMESLGETWQTRWSIK